jgi:hypothetical protein
VPLRLAGGEGRLSVVAAAAGTKALWFLTRGTGVVTLLLLTVAVVLGVVTSVRWASARWPRFVVEWMHRNISLLVMVFLAVHVATAVIDAFAPIRWVDALIPFSSSYRPLWVGFGALALDLLVAVAVTSLLRVRVGYRAWRAVHWAAYACWPLALVHGLGAGSDSRQGWMLAVDAVAMGAVVLAVFWRVSFGWPGRLAGRVAAIAASVALPVAVAAWAVVGPLRPGWARVAGTPPRLLAASSPAPSDPTTSPAPAPAPTTGLPALPFSAAFSGTAEERRAGDGSATIDLHGPLSGTTPLVLDISLRGRALEDGLALDDGTVEIGPPGEPAQYRGDVTDLRGGRIEAVVADAAGDRAALSAVVEVGEDTVRGVVHANAVGGNGQ